MKNQELYSLREALEAVSSYKGLSFAIAVAKNLKVVRAEIQVLEEARDAATPVPSDEFLEYDNKRVELAETYSDKDDDGKAKVDRGRYVLLEQREDFDKAVKQLQSEYPEVMGQRKADILKFEVEFKELMDADNPVELFTVPEGHLPLDITADRIVPLLGVMVDSK